MLSFIVSNPLQLVSNCLRADWSWGIDSGSRIVYPLLVDQIEGIEILSILDWLVWTLVFLGSVCNKNYYLHLLDSLLDFSR